MLQCNFQLIWIITFVQYSQSEFNVTNINDTFERTFFIKIMYLSIICKVWGDQKDPVEAGRLLLLPQRSAASSRTPPCPPPAEATPGRCWSSWVCAACRSAWGRLPWTAAPAGPRWPPLRRRCRRTAWSARSPARSGTSPTGRNSPRGRRRCAGCAPWRSWCCPQSSVREGSPACGGTGSEVAGLCGS